MNANPVETSTRSRGSSRVTTIRLANPKKRNALSLETLRSLTEAFSGVERDVGVVVVEAVGPVFSSGHDLGEMIGRPDRFYSELFSACTEMMLSMQSITQPVIAKVRGPATAAGCQLVASCDLAVASEDAWFATPGVKIGLFCSTPMVPVSKAVGRKRAMQMLLTGDPIPATTAVEWGLINSAVPDSELDEAVDELVDKILGYSSDTIGRGKTAFYDQVDQDLQEAYRRSEPAMASNAGSADAQEGMSAFLEKRPAKWSSSTESGN